VIPVLSKSCAREGSNLHALRRRNLKAKQGDVGEHEGGISAAACASEGVEEHAGTRSRGRGVPQADGQSTEHDGVALELARALTAATAAGQWQLASRIMAEIEARRGGVSETPVEGLPG
jgi:hypothetical protein